MIGPLADTSPNRSTRSAALKRPALAIATYFALLAAPMVSLTPARDVAAETYFGCDVTPGVPALENGEVVAKTTVECQVAWSNREIRTELWQLASGGGWAPIEDSITTWEGSDRVLPLHYPDSTGIDCAILDNSTRDFQSRIFIDDGAGHIAVVVSGRMRLGRDCLAASGVHESTSRVGAEAAGGITCGIVPSEPVRQGGQIRAKTLFDCDALQNGEIRYLRVRLVENTPGPFDKAVRNRAFADSSGLDRAFNLIAACNAKDSGTVAYYNASREVLQLVNGDQPFPTGRVDSGNRNIKARCK